MGFSISCSTIISHGFSPRIAGNSWRTSPRSLPVQARCWRQGNVGRWGRVELWKWWKLWENYGKNRANSRNMVIYEAFKSHKSMVLSDASGKIGSAIYAECVGSEVCEAEAAGWVPAGQVAGSGPWSLPKFEASKIILDITGFMLCAWGNPVCHWDGVTSGCLG